MTGVASIDWLRTGGIGVVNCIIVNLILEYNINTALRQRRVRTT